MIERSNILNPLRYLEPQNELEAKFSLQFCLGILLLHRRAGIQEFTDEVVRRPDVVEMMKKMNVGLQPINVTAAYTGANFEAQWDKAAIYYLQNYEDRWTTWMPADNIKKVKEALAA